MLFRGPNKEVWVDSPLMVLLDPGIGLWRSGGMGGPHVLQMTLSKGLSQLVYISSLNSRLFWLWLLHLSFIFQLHECILASLTFSWVSSGKGYQIVVKSSFWLCLTWPSCSITLRLCCFWHLPASFPFLTLIHPLTVPHKVVFPFCPRRWLSLGLLLNHPWLTAFLQSVFFPDWSSLSLSLFLIKYFWISNNMVKG